MKRICLLIMAMVLSQGLCFASVEDTSSMPDTVTNKKEKKAKKVKPYKEPAPIGNVKFEETAMTDGDIKIIRIRYRAESDVGRYAHGYEYIVINNGSAPIIFKEVSSPDFMTQWQLYKKPMYGMVDGGVATSIEQAKFLRSMPKNQTIAPNGTLGMRVLADLKIKPEANFIFLINEKEHNIKF